MILKQKKSYDQTILSKQDLIASQESRSQGTRWIY